ncbi:MAG: phosphatase PAP2 family protein [Ignavibacteriae bacterium]|nr:MAG: phosphatase PAP2 family protein [Ignavibacteriota bacterium]
MRTILIHLLAACLTFSASAQTCGTLPWEANLTYQANTIESTALRDVSKVASDALIPLAVGIPAGLYLYGITNMAAFNGDQSAWRYSSESGLQMAVTMGVTYGITLLLKNVIDRPRPYQAYPDCITNYAHDADGSMPSGHSAGSAALATSLSLRYPEWYVIAPSVLYALYTGFARMNLGMHYLSDVLAGYALGVGVAVGIHAINEELFDLADPILPDKPTTLIMPGMSMNIINISVGF